jgi:hypothetical protein
VKYSRASEVRIVDWALNRPYWKKTAVSGSRSTVITAVSGRAMNSRMRMALVS